MVNKNQKYKSAVNSLNKSKQKYSNVSTRYKRKTKVNGSKDTRKDTTTAGTQHSSANRSGSKGGNRIIRKSSKLKIKNAGTVADFNLNM